MSLDNYGSYFYRTDSSENVLWRRGQVGKDQKNGKKKIENSHHLTGYEEVFSDRRRIYSMGPAPRGLPLRVEKKVTSG